MPRLGGFGPPTPRIVIGGPFTPPRIQHALPSLAVSGIGHCKTDGHLDRNYLKGRLGDQINAVMSAVGYNMRLILKWLRHLLCKIIAAIVAATTPCSALRSAS